MVVPLHSILKHQKGKDATPNGTSKANSSSSSSTANGKGKSSRSTKSSSSSKASGRRGHPGVQPVVVPEGCLEGTRLTLVNVPNQPDAVEFSIRWVACVCAPGGGGTVGIEGACCVS